MGGTTVTNPDDEKAHAIAAALLMSANEVAANMTKIVSEILDEMKPEMAENIAYEIARMLITKYDIEGKG